jgi:hypothetical protein
MSDIKFYLNGLERAPQNWYDVEFQFDFRTRNIRELELTVKSLRFVNSSENEAKTEIDEYKSTYGDYYAMPCAVKYSNGITVDYMLDWSKEDYLHGINYIDAPMVLKKGSDNFFDRADGCGWGQISWTSADFSNVDYVIIKNNQISYYIMMGLTAYNLGQALAQSIRDIAEGITDIIKASVPVGVPPAPDWGAIIIVALKVLLRVAFAIAITIALIKLAQEIIEAVFPQIRQFKAIKFKKLIEKGCEYLGYTLESTLLDSLSQLTILPVPSRAKDPTLFKELFAPLSLAFTEGHPTSRDTIKTLGQSIESIEGMFNARTRVYDGVVKIETESYFEQNAQQGMNLAFNIQDNLENEYGINSEEIAKRTYGYYLDDPKDVNTYDNTTGTIREVSSELISSPDPDLELIKGSNQIPIPFARGTAKEELNFVEKIVKSVAQAIDNFTGGGLAAKINNRKDVLQIEDQYFSVTKLLWVSGNKLSKSQNDYIGTEKIFEYHSSNFIENNQKKVFKSMPLALTQEELFNLLGNNFVNLDNGSVAEIEFVSWNDEKNLATVDYTVKKVSTNEKTIVINSGNE